MPGHHPPSGRLNGRRIVIAGAASGIGRATAELFAAEGAALTLLDRNGAALAEVGATTGCHVAQADVTEEAAVAAAMEQAASAMGGIDGLVYSAGIALSATVAEADASAWRRVIDVNLTGAYLAVRACLPALLAQTGSTIVTVASGQGLLANAPKRTAYAASKGGLVNLTRALAAELAPGIRCNCVCPGLVDTPFITGLRPSTDGYALKRMAEPAEIARAILFLTSAEASFVTGSALAVDGGRTFH